MESRQIKILAIDDNPDNLVSIKAQISDIFPYVVMHTASGGKKGLELAAAEKPDIILLDVIMPGMDGFEVCRKLKADKDLCDIPVVFITAIKGDKESRIRALESGAEAFLSKPIDESELTAQIRAMLKINTANLEKRNEKERLSTLVEERTRELQGKNMLTINLLEDLRIENENRKLYEKKLEASEEHYRILTQSANDAIVTINVAGEVTEWNSGAEKIFGYSKEEINGKPITIILPQQSQVHHNQNINLAASGSESHVIGKTTELIGKHKNGLEFPMELSLSEWETASEKFFTGIIRDISERKQAEAALRDSEKRYRGILANLDAGVVIHAPDTSIIMSNPKAAELLGLSELQMEGKLAFDPEWHFIDEHKNPLPLAEYPVNKIKSHKSILNDFVIGVYRPVTDDVVWLLVNGFPALDENEDISEILISFIDLTERKQAADLLQKSEEKYRAIFDNVQDVFYQTDLEGRVVEISPSILHLCEYNRDELIGKAVSVLYNKSNERGVLVNAILRNGELWDYELELKTKSGETKFVSINARLIKDNDGRPIHIDGSIRDISERKTAEEKVRKIGLHYQAIIEKAPDGIVLINAAGDFKFVSPAAKKMFGYQLSDEPVGNPAQYTHPDDLQKVLTELSRIIQDPAYSTTLQYRFKDKNGNWRWVESTFSNLLADPAVEAIVINLRDVNDRKLAEAKLQESEEFSRYLLQTIPFGMDIVDEKGTILFQSDNMKELFGEAAIGHTCWELYREDKKQCAECPLNKGIKLGNTEVYETSGVLGGRTFEIIHTGIIHKDKEAMLEIFVDITGRKQAEQELIKARDQAEESEAIIIAALENSQAGIAIAEVPSGKLKYVNKAALLIRDNQYNEKVEDADIADYFAGWQILHFDGTPFPADETPLNRTVLYGETNSREFIVRRDNKEDRYVWANAAPIFNLKGIQTSAIVVFLDITERKQIEKELLRSEKELKRAQEITHIGSWYLDVATNQVVWTEELYKMYGFDSALPPPPYTEHQKLFTPESWELLSTSLAKTTETGIPYELELKTVRADGSNGWMWVRGETEYDTEGKTTGLWGAAQDITERKLADAELVKARNHAEESDRLKSAFLANMSHEIRTPMNGILGFAELLKMPGLTGEQQQEYIGIIKRSGDRMLNIINNIVDISKIESGQMTNNLTETNINESLEFVHHFFEPETKAKGVDLQVTHKLPAEQAVIETDREKIYAILTNLVKNAIKFSDSGTISIGYHLKEKFLEFFVKDKGIGIPYERQQAIFERFIQADISDKRAFQGAGLGLSISKAYAEMLGGKIWVESQEGEGSTFYFTIPYKQKKERNAGVWFVDPDEINLKKDLKLKVLVVEDDEISQKLVNLAVGKISKEILNVNSGFDAVEVCRNTPDIDLILMDIKMPIMDGYEATQQIREFNKETVIIAQTAFGLSGDKEKALAAGCNGYISKPLNIALLTTLIQKHFNMY